MTISQLKNLIRDVPDFPKAGIIFKDISPLIEDRKAWAEVVDQMAHQTAHLKPSKVVGIESRGFLFAAVLALKLGAGLCLIRKKGKLPFKTKKQSYSLEYGEDQIEMHIDAISSSDRVLVVDDVLATGGTAKAAMDLCESFGGCVVGAQFLIEISALQGRSKLLNTPIFSLLEY